MKTWMFFLAAWISGERNPRVTDPFLFPICSNESDPKTPNQKPTGSTSAGESLDLVGLLVPLKGGIGSIWGPQTKARYISGIFPANWGMDYATDPTCQTGTRNNH